MATSNLTSNVVGVDEKVKGSASDPTPDYLDGKVDGSTMTVVSDELVRAALTGDVTTVGNAATVVGGNAATVTTNANLTGDVTSVGNATTTVTNANLTGVVTSTGNATAIADKALAIAKLADGTDGELVTWDASGVIDTVAVGTVGQVLTSGGVGVAPTMQTPSGGGSSGAMVWRWGLNADLQTIIDTTTNATTTTRVYTGGGIQSTGSWSTRRTERYIKRAGIDDISYVAQIWGESGGWSHFARLRIGGVDGLTTGAVASSSPAWSSEGTLDISALSDGTVYTLEAQTRHTRGANARVWLGAFLAWVT